MALEQEKLHWAAERFLIVEGKREDSLLRFNFSWR